MSQTYRCPKCGYFLVESQPHPTNTVRAFCRGKCRKFRTIRLSDGTLLGERQEPTKLRPLTALAA